MSVTEKPEVRTDDLTLATYLNLNGFKHDRLEMKDRRSAQWIFSGGDDLLTSYELYQAEEALVEPLTFTLKFSEVRKEMFAFVNANTDTARSR